eukprot:TRINITY_DN7429_c0_g1_i1.p1 TRINITY_DN7429_c0_g1~~TRINITY_DN7429_c0_g1_i1.p1  ORF type:complete len:347 (-),score=57.21 TRINITY_DN7429_c0_g1_i1:35-1075(-)
MTNELCPPSLCHDRGVCLASDVEGLWSCQCNYYWDRDSNCSLNYFDIYEEKGLFFPVLQLFLVVPLLVVTLLELYCDVRVKGKKVLSSPNFITKVLLAITTLLRFMLTLEEIWRAHARDADKLLIFESVLWNITISSSFFILNYIILSWIDLMTRIKGMATSKTTHLHKAKQIIYLGILIFVFPTFLLGILSVTKVIGELVWTIGLCWVLFYVMLLVFWSSYHVHTLRGMFASASAQLHKVSARMEDTQRKNNLMILANFLLVLNVIATILFVALEARRKAWTYFYLTGLTTTLQHLVLVSFLLVVERYLTKSPFCRGYWEISSQSQTTHATVNSSNPEGSYVDYT